MTAPPSTDVTGCVALPTLVRGRLCHPPELPLERLRLLADAPARAAGEGVIVLPRPELDGRTLQSTGATRLLVLARPDGAALVEPADALEELLALPYGEVLEHVAALADRLRATPPAREERRARILAAQVAGLFDPAAVAAAVDRDLGGLDGPGRAYLDDWVQPGATAVRGATARLAERVLDVPAADQAPPRVRAVPTRQLHITSGNSPLVPAVSLLWALATKGAATVKLAEEGVEQAAMLAPALRDAGADHPLTRHLSLVYWPGGDARIERSVLTEGAFDRWVAWGGAEAMERLRARGGGTHALLFGPRVAVSLIGREALRADPTAVARAAAADSLVTDQAACTASLVHYVEGTLEQAREYCEELVAALAAWDRELPLPAGREAAGRLRRLRRGAFAHGTWFENGTWPFVTSVVVLLPSDFDLSLHPAGRCVVVRQVDDLRDALPALGPEVGAVGVAPDAHGSGLADAIVARGVDAVLPLGDAERGFPGMPHDGLRVLSELVRWVRG